MKINESHMCFFIMIMPEELLGYDLKFIESEYTIPNVYGENKNGRVDLVFQDKSETIWLIEVQQGKLDKKHFHKIVDYRDAYVQHKNQKVISVIVAESIDPIQKKILKKRNIKAIEIPVSRYEKLLEDHKWVIKNELKRTTDFIKSLYQRRYRLPYNRYKLYIKKEKMLKSLLECCKPSIKKEETPPSNTNIFILKFGHAVALEAFKRILIYNFSEQEYVMSERQNFFVVLGCLKSGNFQNSLLKKLDKVNIEYKTLEKQRLP